MKATPSLALLASFGLLVSCGKSPEPTAEAPAPAASEALLSVFGAAPSGEPASIHKVRATAKPGEPLTLQGLVMGRAKPFVDGRAIFILGDPEKLTPCNENPEDACPTPWDACCDEPEDIKAGTATIQVVDGTGQVLKESIENVAGLKPLASVIVSGTVAEGSSADLLLLNASSIQIVEKPRS